MALPPLRGVLLDIDGTLLDSNDAHAAAFARAFAELEAGAELFCLHKERWWQTARGPLLDAGAFVGLPERVQGRRVEQAEARLVGGDVDSGEVPDRDAGRGRRAGRSS